MHATVRRRSFVVCARFQHVSAHLVRCDHTEVRFGKRGNASLSAARSGRRANASEAAARRSSWRILRSYRHCLPGVALTTRSHRMSIGIRTSQGRLCTGRLSVRPVHRWNSASRAGEERGGGRAERADKRWHVAQTHHRKWCRRRFLRTRAAGCRSRPITRPRPQKRGASLRRVRRRSRSLR